jgi:hypothetical protein
MIKVSTWMPVEQLEEIKKVKGDISTGLWIRRAIQNSLSEGEATNQTPKAAPVEEVVTPTTTTTHHPSLEEATRKKSSRKEAEA